MIRAGLTAGALTMAAACTRSPPTPLPPPPPPGGAMDGARPLDATRSAPQVSDAAVIPDGPSASSAPAMAATRPESLCEASDREACLAPSRAACERGDADACVEYGRREMASSPGSRDFKVITRAYRKACTLKNAAGCRWLAFLYERGPEGMSDAIESNVPYDQKEARRLYVQACAWGDRKACERVAAIDEACVHGGLYPERHHCVWIAAEPADALDAP